MRFQSFVWGGFEGASHRRRDGRRVDSIAASEHDRQASLDYELLSGLGIRTVREALRWHLVERRPGHYDWDSARLQAEAAVNSDMEVVWDICHWGVPHGLDVMAEDWPSRLARFAVAAARFLRDEGVRIGGWIPINEIAFWAWAGGMEGHFEPFLRGQGSRLKRQLARGHLATVRALRDAGFRQPILLSEPLIHVLPRDGSARAAARARAMMDGAFEAVDWLLEEEPHAIDVLGINHYPHNQWVEGGKRVLQADPRYRRMRHLIGDVAARFSLPMILTETGAEEPDGDAWLAYVQEEAMAVAEAGEGLLAVCVYPITDYAGWDNERHCPCGPIGHGGGGRFLRQGQAAAIRRLEHDRGRWARRTRESCSQDDRLEALK